MAVCAQCHRYEWQFQHGGAHVCPPRWQVYEEGYHAGWDEARSIYARTPDEAAEFYAQEADEGGDYDIVAGRSTPLVHVRRYGDEGGGHAWFVQGETVAHYRARLRVSRILDT